MDSFLKIYSCGARPGGGGGVNDLVARPIKFFLFCGFPHDIEKISTKMGRFCTLFIQMIVYMIMLIYCSITITDNSELYKIA